MNFCSFIVIALLACGPQEESKPNSQSNPASAEQKSHSTTENKNGGEPEDKDGAREFKSAHHHVAPHGGTLIELGDEFAHVEFTLDPATGSVTAYALDGHCENAERMTQETLEFEIFIQESETTINLLLNAKANTLTGETVGDTSEYAGQNDSLKGVTKFQAKLLDILIKGRRFADVPFEFPAAKDH